MNNYRRTQHYTISGVNLLLGDVASDILYNAAKLTWENRKGTLGEVVEIFPGFRGIRGINVGGLPSDSYCNLGFDGLGTKVDLGQRTGRHDTLAYDLFAMVCDDAVRYGAEPVIIGSVFDVKSLGGLGNTDEQKTNLEFIKQLAVGYVNAANEANVAIVNGEVAELTATVTGYGSFNYNWSAGVLWFARKGNMITGYEVQDGDALVGLREEGFRSNGLTLFRYLARNKYGDEWHLAEYDGKNIAELALQPSRIYTRAVVEMFGGFYGEPKAKIHGIAHITGGGIPEKLYSMLEPSGKGADITDPFEPSRLMLHCQEIGEIPDTEAYSVWNMGQGMIIATPEPENVMNIAEQYEIPSKVIGTVSSEPGIRIRSKGLSAERKTLVF